MGVRLMSQAFSTDLPTSQKMVLLVLCDFANDDGLSCHPSIAAVAKKASVSDRQCKRLIRELETLDLVKVVGNQYGGKPGSTRHYQINVERLLTLSTGDTHVTGDKLTRVTNGAGTGDKCNAGRVTNEAQTGDTHVTGDKLTRVTNGAGTGDKCNAGRVTNEAQTGDTHVTQPPIDPPIDPPVTPQKDTRPAEAIDYLNQVTGSRFQKTDSNCGYANARISEGAELDDLKTVIDFKAAEWAGDPKWSQYLRPQTLFGAQKFPGYLVAAKASAPQSFTETDYSKGVTADGRLS